MKSPVALITDPIYLQHDTEAWHPESPERLKAIDRHIGPLKKSLVEITPIRVSEKILRLVHPAEHIEKVRIHCGRCRLQA